MKRTDQSATGFGREDGTRWAVPPRAAAARRGASTGPRRPAGVAAGRSGPRRRSCRCCGRAAFLGGFRAQDLELAPQGPAGGALAVQVALHALDHPARSLVGRAVGDLAVEQLLAQAGDLGALGREQPLAVLAGAVELRAQALGLLRLGDHRALRLLARRREPLVHLGGGHALGLDAVLGVGLDRRQRLLARGQQPLQARDVLARHGQLVREPGVGVLGRGGLLLQPADEVAERGALVLLVAGLREELLDLRRERVAFLAHRAQPVELVLELLVRGLQAAVGEPQPGELVGLGRATSACVRSLESAAPRTARRELRGEPLGLRPCRLELGLRRGQCLRVGGEQLDLAPGLRDLGPQHGQLRGLIGAASRSPASARRRSSSRGSRPARRRPRAATRPCSQPLGVGAGAVGVRAQRSSSRVSRSTSARAAASSAASGARRAATSSARGQLASTSGCSSSSRRSESRSP